MSKGGWIYTFNSTAKASGSIDSITAATGINEAYHYSNRRTIEHIAWQSYSTTVNKILFHVDIGGVSTYSWAACQGGHIDFDPPIAFSSIACSFTSTSPANQISGAVLTGGWE